MILQGSVVIQTVLDRLTICPPVAMKVSWQEKK